MCLLFNNAMTNEYQIRIQNSTIIEEGRNSEDIFGQPSHLTLSYDINDIFPWNLNFFFYILEIKNLFTVGTKQF